MSFFGLLIDHFDYFDFFYYFVLSFSTGNVFLCQHLENLAQTPEDQAQRTKPRGPGPEDQAQKTFIEFHVFFGLITVLRFSAGNVFSVSAPRGLEEELLVIDLMIDPSEEGVSDTLYKKENS